MGRSSLRHNREIQGIDSAGETPEKYGEHYNNRTDANGDPVNNPNGPAAVAFYGPINDQVAIVDEPFSLSTGQFFSGGDTPLVYTLTGGILPSGGALDADTGEINGTLDTIGTAAGLEITATDASLDTAVSNTFEIDVVAA